MASTGAIARLIRDRGFGFVREDGQQDELFFHLSAVEGTAFDDLQEGQRVTFDKERDPRGRGNRAAHVRLV